MHMRATPARAQATTVPAGSARQDGWHSSRRPDSGALATIGLGVALVPASMANVHFSGVAYRPLKSPAFMDVRCYYLRGEGPLLLGAMLETVRGFRADEERGVAGQCK